MLTALFIFLTVSAQAAPLCADCNLVVIAMDAVQARHTGLLSGRKNTPTLEALARRGYVFTQAISPASWTVPAYLSIFSSLHPSQHGLTNRYRVFSKEKQELNSFRERTPEVHTLAQILKENGFRTGGFTGDSGVSAVLGYDKGFEKYTDEVKFGGLDNSARHALKWLAGVKKGERFFLFVHGYDSHGQFDLPAAFQPRFKKAAYRGPFKGTAAEQGELREKALAGETLKVNAEDIGFWRDWYDSKIMDADERVGRLLKALGDSGRLANTLVVVVSDHGTEFFEHGRVDHGHSLYDELIHVPLLFHFPEMKSGRRIPQQVSTLDLLPTLLEVLAVEVSPTVRGQMRGRSLTPLMSGKSKAGHDVFSETDYRNYTHKRALRTADGWKYIMTLESGREELFDLNKDPRELNNLAESKPAAGRLKRLKAKLTAHLDGLPSPATGGCLPVYQGQCGNP